MTDQNPNPEDVLRRMLAMKPKPKEGKQKPPLPSDQAASGKSAGS